MEFCPECGAMLLPKDGILKCNSCGHEKNLADNNDYEVSEEIQESDNVKMLGEDAYNDLSLDMVFEHISENDREKKIIRDIMTKIESDPEVIRYRCDVFDDIIRY